MRAGLCGCEQGRLEVNVGAGGIGFYIQTYVRSFQYDKAASVTIAVVVMVIAIEAINVALRRRFA